MGDVTTNAFLAVLFGGVLAVLLFLPVVAVRYRRAGRLRAVDLLLLLGAAVYGLAIWTYTLLPVPEAGSYTCVGAQLEPLRTIRDARRYSSGTTAELLRNPVVLQVLLNVVLFVPFGFFVRAVLRRGFVVATALGLAVSLLIETTQRTGLWGIYDCAYRVFDVDDLILNTTGATLGSLVAIPLVALLDRGAGRGTVALTVTLGRRWVGMASDALFVLLLGTAATVAWRSWNLYVEEVPLSRLDPAVDAVLLWGLPGLVQAVTVLLRGRTVGEYVVQVRAVPRPGARLWVLPRRVVKLAFGVGGWLLLWAAAFPGATVALVVFLVVTALAPLASADRRGLAQAASGLRLEIVRPRAVVADREPAVEAAGRPPG
ncbi:VanZ family protein [Nocardioides alkalitolerans]|uniref:VanZ family protein n=1 Tax=Nocardioides alkalitolerans TaxID=281714 RepID=UPI0004195187|nr:VanZ family protein [Nocardioides alkalitolerans]